MSPVTKHKGFTLVELLVSISILTLLVLFMSRLLTSATAVTTSGDKRIDSDGQTRAFLDRMAIDFTQMVKRSDVDFYLKTPTLAQTGNDQIAFYSGVQGYSAGTAGSISLIAYRINSDNKAERMAKGLVWNGDSSATSPVVFLPLTISATWPTATNNGADADYEVIAPSVFRIEYSYLLISGAVSDTPWDSVAGHTSVAGLKDVAAISVYVAAIDSKSRALISNTQLSALAANMVDSASTMPPGDLLAQWQATVDGTTGVPRTALSNVRLYQRQFRLPPKF